MGNFTTEELDFLSESNAIEGEYSKQAMADAKHAWAYARKLKTAKAVTYKDVLEIHRLLMVKLNPRIAGEWRYCTVYVGNHVAPVQPESVIKQRLQDEVLKYVNGLELGPISSASVPAFIEETKQCHVRFEKLHPFEDGNGRVGRILYNLHRIRFGLPIHVIKADERQDYYQWFRE